MLESVGMTRYVLGRGLPKRMSFSLLLSSVVLIAVKVCPHRGPGLDPTIGKGRGLGAAAGSDTDSSWEPTSMSTAILKPYSTHSAKGLELNPLQGQ